MSRGAPGSERRNACRSAPAYLRPDQRSARGHATIEKEIFYPAVKKARSDEVKDEVREAYEEHKQVKALLAAIAEISPDDESYSAKIKD
jgi:hypothetical protein